MKANFIKSSLALALSLLAGPDAPAQSGGPFAITSFSIAGGGGASTGGVYRVQGNLGQAATGGPLTNATFSLTSGFWPQIVVVPTPDGPPLSVRVVPDAQGGAILVSWPVSLPGAPKYRLQAAEQLAGPESWADSISPIVILDGQNTVAFRPIFNPPRPVQFFRLIQEGP